MKPKILIGIIAFIGLCSGIYAQVINPRTDNEDLCDLCLQVPVSLTLFIQKIRMQESAIAVQELTFMIVNQKNNIYSRCITIYP